MKLSRRTAIAGAASAALAWTGTRVDAADPITINLATLPGDPGSQPYYAQELGFFKAAGLDVKITLLQNGGSAVAALVSGALDVANATVGVIALAHEHGVPIRNDRARGNVYRSRAHLVVDGAPELAAKNRRRPRRKNRRRSGLQRLEPVSHVRMDQSKRRRLQIRFHNECHSSEQP